jgi:probable HAF family extracellular repeat protein
VVLLFAAVTQPAAAQAEFAYVANSSSNNIAGYKMNPATGAWTPVPGSPFTSGRSGAVSVVVDQSKRFLYVANQFGGDNNVAGFRIDPFDGSLLPLPGSPFAAGSGPTAIALDPLGRFAYVANAGSNNVSAYRIQPATGKLVALPGSPFPAGNQPSGVTVDPKGSFVYVTNAGSNTVSGYTIDSSTGVLTPVAGSPFTAGTYPQSVAVDPLTLYAYVANQGSDNVSGYSISATTGALTPVLGSPFSTGAGGVFGVTVEPQGHYVYVAGYGGIFAFSIGTQFIVNGHPFPTLGPGSLTPVSGSPFGTGTNVAYGDWTPNSVAVDYTGTFAYASSGPYGSGNVSAFSISSGSLTPLAGSPFPTGEGSVSIALVRPFTTPVYSATHVPSPDFLPSQFVFPYGINNKGQVSGSVVYQPEGSELFASGFLYAGGTTVAIGFTRSSSAFGINDNSEVVGETNLGPPVTGRPPQQAFLYSNGATTNLDTVSGRQSSAVSINNAGQVTGSLSTGTCNLFACNLGDTHAFLYNGGGLIDIGTLGGNYSAGSGINDREEITGGSNVATNGPSHLFLYRSGTMHDLGTTGGVATSGRAINNNGEIIGSAKSGFLYRNGTFHLLPLLHGGTINTPGGINNQGFVVGSVDVPGSGPTHAYIYQLGGLSDLNLLVDPSLPLLTNAAAINDHGQIVTTGLNGQMYLLTPNTGAPSLP